MSDYPCHFLIPDEGLPEARAGQQMKMKISDRMPPPSYCSKVSTRSTGDHEPEINNDVDNSKSEISNFDDTTSEDDCTTKYDGVGIVKSLLGPSLEDAVLRTLEFGKCLIQKTEENESKKMFKQSKKGPSGNMQKQDCDLFIEEEIRHGMKDECKDYPEDRAAGKRIGFDVEPTKNALLYPKPNNTVRKFTNVSKIRSLDSDLKQVSPSPEKIKRQLEALIQIDKDGPAQRVLNWNIMSKTPRVPMEMTVMPTLCGYKKEVDLNCSSSCDVQSQSSRRMKDIEPCSSSRLRGAVKKRMGAPNKICQAPEFLSNALGPTLDVSIIDNLKMMRDIFKCDSAKGEGMTFRQELPKQSLEKAAVQPEVQVRLQLSEEEMACRIEELQKKIEELEQKEECLTKQIEEEECEREAKKKAFEEEEKKLCSMKACLEGLAEGKERELGRMSVTECEFQAKYEGLQQRISCEEEKLTRLKEQYECYKREICEARNRKEALKRNKSLLDAWDVIASRVCHTRLPSFSKAYHLERKNFQPNDASEDIHCCLTLNQPPMESPRPCSAAADRKSRSRASTHHSSSECGWDGHEPSPGKGRKKHEDIPFPIQRDITCGLHQSLKTCSCSQDMKIEGVMTCSSEDDLLKKHMAAHKDCKREACCYSSSLDTSAEVLLRKPPCGKAACRSKSDTTLRNNCAKIVKVMWAVTRINIFQDNCKTYEVMDATSTPPPCVPARTEGIFVVKSNQKKCCQSPSKRRSNISGI